MLKATEGVNGRGPEWTERPKPLSDATSPHVGRGMRGPLELLQAFHTY